LHYSGRASAHKDSKWKWGTSRIKHWHWAKSWISKRVKAFFEEKSLQFVRFQTFNQNDLVWSKSTEEQQGKGKFRIGYHLTTILIPIIASAISVMIVKLEPELKTCFKHQFDVGLSWRLPFR
jgi:hypothetical protein